MSQSPVSSAVRVDDDAFGAKRCRLESRLSVETEEPRPSLCEEAATENGAAVESSGIVAERQISCSDGEKGDEAVRAGGVAITATAVVEIDNETAEEAAVAGAVGEESVPLFDPAGVRTETPFSVGTGGTVTDASVEPTSGDDLPTAPLENSGERSSTAAAGEREKWVPTEDVALAANHQPTESKDTTPTEEQSEAGKQSDCYDATAVSFRTNWDAATPPPAMSIKTVSSVQIDCDDDVDGRQPAAGASQVA